MTDENDRAAQVISYVEGLEKERERLLVECRKLLDENQALWLSNDALSRENAELRERLDCGK